MDNSTLSKQIWLGAGLCDNSSDGVKYFLTVALVFLCWITCFGNVFVLTTIFKNQSLRTGSAFLIAITAAIDLFLGSTVIPLALWIVWNEKLKTLLLLDFFWLFGAVILLSVSTVLLFTVYRFFNVYQFGRYKLSVKKIPITVFVCWIPPLLITASGAIGIVMLAEVFIALYYILCSALVVMIDICTMLLLSRKASNVDTNTQFRDAQHIRRHMGTLMVRALFIVAPVASLILESLDLHLNMFCVISSLVLFGTSAVNPFIHCFRFPSIGVSVSAQFTRLWKRTDSNGNDSDEDWTLVDDECSLKAELSLG